MASLFISIRHFLLKDCCCHCHIGNWLIYNRDAAIIKEAVYSHADKGLRIQTQNSEEYIHRYRTILS